MQPRHKYGARQTPQCMLFRKWPVCSCAGAQMAWQPLVHSAARCSRPCWPSMPINHMPCCLPIISARSCTALGGKHVDRAPVDGCRCRLLPAVRSHLWHHPLICGQAAVQAPTDGGASGGPPRECVVYASPSVAVQAGRGHLINLAQQRWPCSSGWRCCNSASGS